MKLLAVADIHGATDLVDRIIGGERGIDTVVVAGDITTHGSPLQVEGAIRTIMRHGIPVVAVAGNMDSPGSEENLMNLGVSLNGRGIVVGEAGFSGISASPATPFGTPYEISEEEIARRGEEGRIQLPPTRWRIFVPHSPPFGTGLDRTLSGLHVGSRAVRAYVERNTPDLLICGHIHEARGTDLLGRTLLLNCGTAARGEYALVTLDSTIRVDLR